MTTIIAFFFSSRRRHTRCGRDWSSDVCSSDLRHPRPHDPPARRDHTLGGVAAVLGGEVHHRAAGAGLDARSEERRVGKECRSRWPTDSYKKKGVITDAESQMVGWRWVTVNM